MRFSFFPRICFSYLNYLDFFQQHIFLKIKGKSKTSLLLGKLFSIGIITFLLYHIFSSDMIMKTNPIVLQQLLKAKERPQIDINENNFRFAFALADDFTLYQYDPTIFNFNVKEVTLLDRVVVSEKIYEFEPCSGDYFKGFSEESIPYQNLSCIKDAEFSLKGYWDEYETKYFSISVNRCQNTTENNNCKSEEEIKEYFKIRYFEAYFLERSFDLKNNDNPISINIKNIFTGLELGRRKEVSNFMKKTKILTDNQATFTKYDEIETFLFEEGFMDFQQSDEELLLYVFYPSDYIMVFQRRYQKLFELLATLGGILNPLLILGSIIVKIFHGWQLDEMIMTNLYSLDLAKTENAANSKAKKVIEKFPIEALKFTLWEKIKFLYKSRRKFNEKERIYSKYLEKSRHKLDLFEILKKLEEIQRLKYLILSKTQMKIFDTFHKKLLFSSDDSINSIYNRYTFETSRVGKARVEDIMLDVEKIKQKNNPTSIERNLIRLVKGNEKFERSALFAENIEN